MTTHRRQTAFEPGVHGFRFSNSWNGADIVAELLDGFEIAPMLPVPDGFWDRWGLCGGMAWHALDCFFMRNPMPQQTTRPQRESDLFRILVARQVVSFRGLALLSECLRWQSRRDQNIWWDPRRGVGAMTQSKHWPRIRASIDAGYPASLCIIRASGATNPTDNHQVLAIGYEYDDADRRVELDLYDPNHPNTRPQISFEIGHPGGRISARQSSGERVRGFFLWPYDRARRLPG